MIIFNISLRIFLETNILTGKGDELLSLIITWLLTSILSDLLKHDNRIIFNICKNSKGLLIEFILVFLIIVLPNIKNIFIKIPIYLLTLCISFIANYIINLVFTNNK